MANESKIRVLYEQPVMGDSGLLYIRVYAGPSGATKPTADLANGSMYIETDNNGNTVYFDEVSGTWPAEE
jgi:hypothetical protein